MLSTLTINRVLVRLMVGAPLGAIRHDYIIDCIGHKCPPTGMISTIVSGINALLPARFIMDCIGHKCPPTGFVEGGGKSEKTKILNS